MKKIICLISLVIVLFSVKGQTVTVTSSDTGTVIILKNTSLNDIPGNQPYTYTLDSYAAVNGFTIKLNVGDSMVIVDNRPSMHLIFFLNQDELYNNATSIQSQFESQYSIYPNPANNILNIDSEFSSKTIKLHDISAREVYVSNETSSNSTIDITSFNSGIYFLTIESDNKKLTKKIIIAH